MTAGEFIHNKPKNSVKSSPISPMNDYVKMHDMKGANKNWWNNVAPIHANSKFYDLASFRKGKSSLFSIEKEEIDNIKGKRLLHLLCHFGMDSLSWAREGADVTGVDISDRSIRLARKLSKETGIPAKFICSDIFDLPSVLNKKFDIIFASYGVLCWLSSIKKWSKTINNFLDTDGMFYMVELHPFTNILSSDFEISYKYFEKGPYIDDSPGTYADWNAKINSATYLWSYSISDVVNSLICEGLKIEFIHEFPFTMYDQFPGLMEKNKKGQYVFKNKKIQIPLLFSLKATK
ncbi:MAG: class I SAM-dependent methyltransferase [Actinobacteria bacterium]|nr:class I SAM-dependent methyltransferase [Actinomycetota bacterium]